MIAKYTLLAALIFSLTLGTASAQDAQSSSLTMPRFTAEAASARVAAQGPIQSFADPQPTRPRISKTKLTLILVGAAAVVTAVLLARGDGSSRALSGGRPVPQTGGPISTTVVINGVPQ